MGLHLSLRQISYVHGSHNCLGWRNLMRLSSPTPRTTHGQIWYGLLSQMLKLPSIQQNREEDRNFQKCIYILYGVMFSDWKYSAKTSIIHLEKAKHKTKKISQLCHTRAKYKSGSSSFDFHTLPCTYRC